MTRIPLFPLANMTEEQRRVYDTVVNGPRGVVGLAELDLSDGGLWEDGDGGAPNCRIFKWPNGQMGTG